MYSINLVKISIDEFERTLLTMHILPSQKMILNNLSSNMQKYKNKGFSNLQELQNLLKMKKDYDLIAQDIDGTSGDVGHLGTCFTVPHTHPASR